MNRCDACGVELPERMTMCLHHDSHEPAWAVTNRIMCDFLHRGVVPARLAPAARAEELRGCLVEVAA